MSKAKKAGRQFIEAIPDHKLKDIPDSTTLLCKNRNFRLDMQGVTTKDPKKWNIQVQINNQTTITTLKREKGKTVSIVLVPIDKTWSPKRIREELLKKLNL
ncbi:hypothetical protein PRK78_002451 [Emydomyces testavorans]|uniref:Uncharacterized protein n=1 Tax=Emydomyces testavorans TaxID=2070801 RepID=A0AAF0DGD7_9EURO|nr:hypothetical protein PRK78_002451 [Emydomyces testavorans]